MKTILSLILLSILFALTGCVQETRNIDMVNDDAKAVLGLDYRDFDQAATEMVRSMIGSGRLRKNDGSRYVMASGRVINDTMQRIDTDQLMAKIEEELLNSGQVVMTSAVGSGDAVDQLVHDNRDLRDNEEFDQSSVAAKGTLLAPDLSISGKILQRNISYDKKSQQVEYYFQLKVTDMKSGLRFWQKETIIGKRGSKKSVAW
jgi:uncharacterized protein (TIGR02722 family)